MAHQFGETDCHEAEYQDQHDGYNQRSKAALIGRCALFHKHIVPHNLKYPAYHLGTDVGGHAELRTGAAEAAGQAVGGSLHEIAITEGHPDIDVIDTAAGRGWLDVKTGQAHVIT